MKHHDMRITNLKRPIWYTWLSKLVTKEDPSHIHKILGVSCLLSFFLRFFCMLDVGNLGFFSYPSLTIPTLILHLLLSLSAFQFRGIPMRRKNDGGQIWPLYRLHSLIFCLRSILTILLYTGEHERNVKPNYFLNLLIVLGTMALADLASWSVKGSAGRPVHNRKTVVSHDLDTHPAIKYFFSYFQFLATANFLFGYRQCTQPFCIIFVLQLTPFLAVLRRRQLLAGWCTNALSFLIFVGCMSISQHDPVSLWDYKTPLIIRTLGQVAALIRMSPLPDWYQFFQNKYFLWTFLYAGINVTRPFLQDEEIFFLVRIVWFVTFGALLLLGWFKVSAQLGQRKRLQVKLGDDSEGKGHSSPIKLLLQKV